MHDPMTVAFRPNKFVTIWHVDPELDGSDDSCGYTYPKAGKELRDKLNKQATTEFPFFFSEDYASINLYHGATAYEVIYAIWAQIRWSFYRKQVTPREIIAILDSAANPNDNLRSCVDRAKHELKEFQRLYWLVWRVQARVNRKWYQRPKWHVKHWRIQFHFGRKIRFAIGLPRAGQW
jgi:hypothetical protein